MEPSLAIRLQDGVREAYSRAAREPDSKHPFPTGFAFAASLGYPENLLRELPAEAVSSFAGVGAVAHYAPLASGSVVLDLGCGSGLDSLVAAQRTGNQGLTVGVDFSKDMLQRARQSAASHGGKAHFLQASAEALPLADAAFHVAIVNGIFNLNPRREAIFRELARVLQPGGTVAGAELILREEVETTGDPSPENWFS
jgi:SAM-dependent methyltransferase